MKTDYKNLTFFEAAAICMIVVGIALIGFQIISSLPSETKAELASALQVFEMSDAVVTVTQVNEFVFGGIENFYDQFAVAFQEVISPVSENLLVLANQTQATYQSFAEFSDNLASNYVNNYAVPGVEAGAGGKIMGAFIQKFSDK